MQFLDREADDRVTDSDESEFSGSKHSDSKRPQKRRRLNRTIVSSPDISDEVTDTDDYDLPTNGHHEDGSGADDDLERQARSKHLMHVPEHAEPYGNTFVTQVDQPLSSPARIRGPRWQKPLRSPKSGQQTLTLDRSARPRAEAVLDEFDDDDPALMEAFLSSPVVENVGQVLDVSFLSDNDEMQRHSQSLQKSNSFRQTTLFGTISNPKEVRPSQSRVHNWPLANRNEPPTHHRLDYEALTTWVYPTNIGTTRDYQYNIVHRGLYHNLLVALPTGLGKTFIAATIMLNWFRWTQDAQIIFVAPTKPLVSQQVHACFNVAGIPRSQTTMLVGNVQPAIRAEEWKSKRVFFMTPQTLINDLKSGICDPKRIVLLVVDEAHRAKGGYAYVEVVKFLKRFNPSFRLLALTATPGSTVESVQEVIDGLDIARVEIRTEESIDIREYVHTRNIEPLTFENSDEMNMALELFATAVRPVMNKLSSQNAYWNKDPTSITLFGLKKARDDWARTAGRNAGMAVKGMINSVFTILMKLAQPLELLKFHGIGPFYHKLKAFEEEAHAGKSGNAKLIVINEHFKKLMNRVQAWINNPDFEGHPKLSYLKTVVLNHFMDEREVGEAAGGQPRSDTRIMVFAHYRDSAEDITRFLNKHTPMIRAHVFVGQAASKNSEGMDQRQQLDIIQKFKTGTYNVLVATSIGEEGLDIGEIDLIICYDASKSPIRMLQRMGRTGRKRAGNIVLLLMKGKEENDFEAAQDNYQKMQALIASGKRFTFHEDRSPRIVPKEIVPFVDKRMVEIPIENTQADLPEPRRRTGKNAKRPPKRFNMPDGVDTGFSFLGEGNKSRNKVKKTIAAPEAVLDTIVAKSPPLSDVLLTDKEELLLERRYAQVAGTEPQFVRLPRFDAYPEGLKRLSNIGLVKHSTISLNIAKAYTAMRDTDREWTRPMEWTEMSEDDVSKGSGTRSTPVARNKPKSLSEKVPQRKSSSTLQSSGTILPLDDQDGDDDSFIDDNIQIAYPLESDQSDDRTDLRQISKVSTTEIQEPFYVSQRSVQVDEDLDKLLPDFTKIVGSKHGAVERQTQSMIAGVSKRRTATRVIYEDEDF